MRYARLLGVQLRASLLLAMQYRAEFLLDGFVEVFWMVPAVVPLAVIFKDRPSLGGADGEAWSFGEALMVVGWFTFLQGVLEGVINPSLMTVVEHIRKGTLDFVLLKPADAQFLVSTARFQPWQCINVFTAMGIFGWGFHRLGHWPSPVNVGVATVAMAAAVVVLYSLWILTVSAAFYLVRVDNLSQLFNAVFDAARWPVSVFPRVVRLLFTFVVPLAVMTTLPAKALLGTLGAVPLAGALSGAALAFAVARGVWKASIAKYTSAGG
jgi:ABC-2 type transport system permease protein